jgi:hypothetical protein
MENPKWLTLSPDKVAGIAAGSGSGTFVSHQNFSLPIAIRVEYHVFP